MNERETRQSVHVICLGLDTARDHWASNLEATFVIRLDLANLLNHSRALFGRSHLI